MARSENLYGLQQALPTIRKKRQVLVFESDTEALALSEAGFENAVATLGTAITSDQIELLFRDADEIVFCFTGGEAGKKRYYRAMYQALPHAAVGCRLSALQLSEGVEPSSLVGYIGVEGMTSALAGRIAFEHRPTDDPAGCWAFCTGGMSLSMIDEQYREMLELKLRAD